MLCLIWIWFQWFHWVGCLSMDSLRVNWVGFMVGFIGCHLHSFACGMGEVDTKEQIDKNTGKQWNAEELKLSCHPVLLLLHALL